MDKVYKLYLADQVSVEGFGRTYKPLEERLKGLEDQIPKLQAELDFMRIQNLSRDELIAGAQSLFDRWSDLLPKRSSKSLKTLWNASQLARATSPSTYPTRHLALEVPSGGQPGHTDSSRRRARSEQGRRPTATPATR